MKHYLTILSIALAVLPCFGAKLYLTEITNVNWDSPTSKFKKPDACDIYFNVEESKGSSGVTLSLEDFTLNRMPFKVEYDIYQPSLNLWRKEKLNTLYLLDRNPAFDTVTHLPKQLLFHPQLNTEIQHLQPKLELRGKVKVTYGKATHIRLKLSEFLERNSATLKKHNITLETSQDKLKEKIRIKINSPDEYLCAYIEGQTDIRFQKSGTYPKNTFDIPEELANDKNIHINILLFSDLSTETIKVNFTVPLKWVDITFPQKGKYELIPIDNEPPGNP